MPVLSGQWQPAWSCWESNPGLRGVRMRSSPDRRQSAPRAPGPRTAVINPPMTPLMTSRTARRSGIEPDEAGFGGQPVPSTQRQGGTGPGYRTHALRLPGVPVRPEAGLSPTPSPHGPHSTSSFVQRVHHPRERRQAPSAGHSLSALSPVRISPQSEQASIGSSSFIKNVQWCCLIVIPLRSACSAGSHRRQARDAA